MRPKALLRDRVDRVGLGWNKYPNAMETIQNILQSAWLVLLID